MPLPPRACGFAILDSAVQVTYELQETVTGMITLGTAWAPQEKVAKQTAVAPSSAAEQELAKAFEAALPLEVAADEASTAMGEQ